MKKVLATEVLENEVLVSVNLETITRELTLEVVPFRKTEWNNAVKEGVLTTPIMGSINAQKARWDSRLVFKYNGLKGNPLFLDYVAIQDVEFLRASVKEALKETAAAV